MKPDTKELRSHMATLTVGELRQVLAVSDGEYTAEAIEAAQRELETRSPHDKEIEVYEETSRSWWEDLPSAVRTAFGYNSLVALFGLIAVAVVVADIFVDPAGLGRNPRNFLALAPMLGVTMTTLTVVIGILKDARFVRQLLALEFMALLGYSVWEAISRPRWYSVAVPLLTAVWLWRFWRDRAVVSYYDHLTLKRATGEKLTEEDDAG